MRKKIIEHQSRKNNNQKIYFKLFLRVFYLMLFILPTFPKPIIASAQKEHDIRIIEEYRFLSGGEKTFDDEKLTMHFIEIFIDDLIYDEHNMTLVLNTKENIKYIHRYYPECLLENKSIGDNKFIMAIFNGTECRIRLILSGSTNYPDPLNLSLDPNDVEIFSSEENGELNFEIILNTTHYLDDLILSVTSDYYPGPIIEDCSVQTQLFHSINRFQNSIDIELSNVSAGGHNIDLIVDYASPKGDFYITATSIISDIIKTPIDLYLNDERITPELKLIFRYNTKNIKFIEGEIPWIYAYQNPKSYCLKFNSTNNLLLRLDDLSRETIEFLVTGSNITNYVAIEKKVYDNPCYELDLHLDDESNIILGIEIKEKIWFIRPSILELEDIPSNIKNEYLTPENSPDGEYIDVDNPIVKSWSQQVIGNETNPYYIAH